jgi:hypothetical protein
VSGNRSACGVQFCSDSPAAILLWCKAGAVEELNMLTSAECRQRAEQKIAEADLHPRGKGSCAPMLSAGWFSRLGWSS